MQFDSALNEGRPVAALLGNGDLATNVGRSGYHDEQGAPRVVAAQEFVMAGRRLKGPHFPLISFGALRRKLHVDGEIPIASEWHQTIDTDLAEVRTRQLYGRILETTRCCILANRNTYFAETRIANHGSADVEIELEIAFEILQQEGLVLNTQVQNKSLLVHWESDDNLGLVTVSMDWGVWSINAVAGAVRNLAPGEECVFKTAVSFSDRLSYQDEPPLNQIEANLAKHEETWRNFWGESEIVTNDEAVDSFRIMALYTLRCQATRWSIPPTLSKPYWDGGSFHDEYYPFVALVSGGWPSLARRIPYFRLSTLPKAQLRAGGEGALYPWSSTEIGEERDPHGHWYTERFHLGQIGACVWTYWSYERQTDVLEDLFPVLRECARYFDRQMLTRDERGSLRTRECTDFDESAGQVCGGPFTMAAAVYLFDHAAEAARRLGKDRDRTMAFDNLSKELRSNFQVDLGQRRYSIPSGKSGHSSILGYIVPFLLDDGSDFARNSLTFIHESARTPLGWKPGFHPAFEGTTWMWTAGHLGMCHTVLGDAEKAWEAVKRGPLSAGQFMSPNEHLNSAGEPVVPWFTTGCGAWLAALHWMFARVDDTGDHVLPAVPLKDFQVRGLRLSRGVSLAVKAAERKLHYFSLFAEQEMTFSFEAPIEWLEGVWPPHAGRIIDLGDSWRIQVDLLPGENVFIG